jgi:predicted acetyltransferase
MPLSATPLSAAPLPVSPLTELRRPDRTGLAAYVDALDRGFLPSNVEGERIAAAHRAAIGADADAFLAGLDDPEGRGPPIRLPDGREVARLPGFTRWIFAGATFGGIMNLRWQPGGDALPPYVLGHIGYVIVPWMRRHGHATRALALLLPQARSVGLGAVELTTDLDNIASQAVIIRNGGVLVGRRPRPAAYGGGEQCLFRIVLARRDDAAPLVERTGA